LSQNTALVNAFDDVAFAKTLPDTHYSF